MPGDFYSVYVLEAAFANRRRTVLYTGITKDMQARLRKHLQGGGAKCLRGVISLIERWQSPRLSKGQALRVERDIKRLHVSEKRKAVTAAILGAESRFDKLVSAILAKS